MRPITILAVFVLSLSICAAEEGSRLQLTDWSYGRERKTITSANRVTANFTIKNITQAPMRGVQIALTYLSGQGEVVAGPLNTTLGALKAGESRKATIVGDFIPVFDGYNILVSADGGLKEEWFSSSDIGQPQYKSAEPQKGVANVVILGKEASPDRAGHLTGTVRVKNLGTAEAKNLKLQVTYYDARQKKAGEWTGPLGNGTLAGSAEATVPFSAANCPKPFGGYQINLNFDDTPPDQALADLDFTNVEDVEVAKYKFARKGTDMTVKAQVRNGFKFPVEKVSLTLVFYGPKKSVAKNFFYEVPGHIESHATQPIEFTIQKLPAYEGVEPQTSYVKLDNVAAPAPSKKIANAGFKNSKDLEVIFQDSDIVAADDGTIALPGSMRNGKDIAIKDVSIMVTFKKNDGKDMAVEKPLPDVLQPGEQRSFVLKTPKMEGGFASYSFKFKYAEAH